MKKELYKLILVFIMVVLAMFLGFFLGREATLKEQKYNQPPKKQVSPAIYPIFSSPNQPPKKPMHPSSKATPSPTSPQQPSPSPTSKPSLTPPTTPPSSSLPQPSLEQPSAQPASPRPTQQKTSPNIAVKPLSLYGLFINSHINKEQAMEHATQLKLRFPKWRFFFKKSGKKYRVYIGPFQEKTTAEEFLHEIQTKPDFQSTTIEKIIFKKSQRIK